MHSLSICYVTFTDIVYFNLKTRCEIYVIINFILYMKFRLPEAMKFTQYHTIKWQNPTMDPMLFQCKLQNSDMLCCFLSKM